MFFSGPLQKLILSILGRGQPKYLSLWQVSYYRVLSQIIFLLFWDAILDFFFLSFPVVWLCQLPIYPRICRFPFLQAFWWVLNLVVPLLLLCVVCQFSLLAWHIFLCTIPFLYLDCIFSQFVLGFTIIFRFCWKVYVVHVNQEVDHFQWFTEIVFGCAFPKDVVEWYHGYHK